MVRNSLWEYGICQSRGPYKKSNGGPLTTPNRRLRDHHRTFHDNFEQHTDAPRSRAENRVGGAFSWADAVFLPTAFLVSSFRQRPQPLFHRLQP